MPITAFESRKEPLSSLNNHKGTMGTGCLATALNTIQETGSFDGAAILQHQLL